MTLYKLNTRDCEGELIDEIYATDKIFCKNMCKLSSSNTIRDYETVTLDAEFIAEFMNETNKRLKRIEAAFRTFSSLDEE